MQRLTVLFYDHVCELYSLKSVLILILFFLKTNEFKFADVATDECVIYLEVGEML